MNLYEKFKWRENLSKMPAKVYRLESSFLHGTENDGLIISNDFFT